MCPVLDTRVRGRTVSTPRDNQDSEAESQGDGLRDEIEEILREQGEKPVMPRPPKARDGGPVNSMAGMFRRFGGGNGNGFPPAAGTVMRATLLLFLLRLAVGLAFAFIAVRILGPRAILLFIVIALAVLALIIIRYMIVRRRYSR